MTQLLLHESLCPDYSPQNSLLERPCRPAPEQPKPKTKTALLASLTADVNADPASEGAVAAEPSENEGGGTRDRSKLRYLQSVAAAQGLPDVFKDVWERNLTREQRTALVNKGVERDATQPYCSSEG